MSTIAHGNAHQLLLSRRKATKHILLKEIKKRTEPKETHDVLTTKPFEDEDDYSSQRDGETLHRSAQNAREIEVC